MHWALVALLVSAVVAVPVLLLGVAIFALVSAADLRTTNPRRAVGALIIGVACSVLFAGLALFVRSAHYY